MEGTKSSLTQDSADIEATKVAGLTFAMGISDKPEAITTTQSEASADERVGAEKPKSRFFKSEAEEEIAVGASVEKFKYTGDKFVNEAAEKETIAKMQQKIEENRQKLPPREQHGISSRAHELDKDREKMYDNAAEIFEFDETVASLDHLVDYRYSEAHTGRPVQLPVVYEKQYDYYIEISEIRDDKEYKRENTTRAERPDILKERIRGALPDTQPLLDKRQELLEILNKYSTRQVPQIIAAIHTLLQQVSEAHPAEIETFSEQMFSQLYDKACLEHKFISIYSTVINALALDRESRVQSFDLFSAFENFKKYQLMKEISTGKTHLSQYHEEATDDTLAKMYKENNYEFHFKGCVLFSAELFKLNSKLVSAEELLEAIFMALSKDLRSNDADLELLRRSKASADLLAPEVVERTADDLASYMLGSAQKAKFDYITLVVQALLFCYNKLQNEEKSKLASMQLAALDAFIFGLTQSNTDALVLFKISQLERLRDKPSEVVRQQTTKGAEKQVGGLMVGKWDEVVAFWQKNGLLETVCNICRTDTMKLNEDLFKEQGRSQAANAQACMFIERFLTQCFEKGQAAELFEEKFEVLLELDSTAEQRFSKLICIAFINSYANLSEKLKKNYVDFLIEKCLRQRNFVYECAEQCITASSATVARDFLTYFNREVIINAYNEILDEYEDAFEEDNVAEFKARIDKFDFEAHYSTFPNLFEELKGYNYTYFNEPDFGASTEFKARATTPFEDLAIFKFCRIYIGDEHPTNTQLSELIKPMSVLKKIFGGKAETETYLALFKDCGFELGAASLHVDGKIICNHPRALFYNEKSVIYTIMRAQDDVSPKSIKKVDATNILNKTLAYIAIETAYAAVKEREDEKRRFECFIAAMKELECVDAATAKQILTIQNKKNDRFGVYEISW